MYSGSDEDRDSTLDKRYIMDMDDPQAKQANSAALSTDIAPNSQYDRSFSFSDDDQYEDAEGSPPSMFKSKDTQKKPNYQSLITEKYADQDDQSDNDDLASPPPTGPYRGAPDVANNNTNYDDDPALPEQTSELASIFSLISNFQPEPIEISVHWKPFLPELQPAIGTIDAFIKVPRPDGEVDDLGLVVLDEPSISQSNPQVLKMELREQYGITSPGNESDGYVGFIENVQANRKALNSWLESIEDIHRHRPPPVLIYTSQMPELEYLMEPWDETFEDTLKACPLPTAELDISLEDYARIICALLEIPVKGNIIESLHHLFSLYAEFEANHYFRSQQ